MAIPRVDPVPLTLLIEAEEHLMRDILATLGLDDAYPVIDEGCGEVISEGRFLCLDWRNRLADNSYDAWRLPEEWFQMVPYDDYTNCYRGGTLEANDRFEDAMGYIDNAIHEFEERWKGVTVLEDE